jgi:cell division protein FtsB
VQTRLPRLFTVRVMVFACVLLLAFILVSPTLHSYVQQRQQLAQLRAQVAAAQARNDDLQSDLSRWDDPAYVQAQARQRLSFVMPGEKAFRVVDPETVPDVEPARESGPSSSLDATGTGPWYQAVWASVEAAGSQPITTDAPTAATKGTTKPDATKPDATHPSGAATSGTTKPGTTTSGAATSGTTKPGTTTSGTTKPGTPTSGTVTSGTSKSGTTKPGTSVTTSHANPPATKGP